MHERRIYPREQSSAIVEIRHPGFGQMRLQARDLSDSGLFAFTGQHVPPPPGTVVEVCIRRHSGTINVQPVPMRVVRRVADGIGLAFV